MNDYISHVTERWFERADGNDLKPGSAAYRKEEAAFAAGAMAAIDAMDPDRDGEYLSKKVPSRWVFDGLMGRPIFVKEDIKHEHEEAAL